MNGMLREKGLGPGVRRWVVGITRLLGKGKWHSRNYPARAWSISFPWIMVDIRLSLLMVAIKPIASR